MIKIVNKSLKEKIYQAQCLGDVEPIEFMVPYPDIAAIVDGMIIKHGDKLLYSDLGWTRKDVHIRIKQTTHWLRDQGVHPKERVFLGPMSFPDAEILAFAVWTLGASLVIADPSIAAEAASKTGAAFSILESPFPDCLDGKKESFEATYIPLLSDEALVYCTEEKSIRLSHYNILVNANGVDKSLNLSAESVLYSELSAHSTAWVVLQAVLPLYTGGSFSKIRPDCWIGKDYTLKFGIQNPETIQPNDIIVLPENTAVLSVGNDSIHMTGIEHEKETLKIEGHSIMMGYLDDEKNEEHFQNGWFYQDRKNV